jgi:hypothetical protein
VNGPVPPAPPPAGPTITSIGPSLILEGTRHLSLIVVGQNFRPGSVVLEDGRALATLFVNSGELVVPNFLGQTVAVRARAGGPHHAGKARPSGPHRRERAEEGPLMISVAVPGVGVSAPMLVQVLDQVSPGSAGTPLERVLAERFESRFHVEAHQSAAWLSILARLRRHHL